MRTIAEIKAVLEDVALTLEDLGADAVVLEELDSPVNRAILVAGYALRLVVGDRGNILAYEDDEGAEPLAAIAAIVIAS